VGGLRVEYVRALDVCFVRARGRVATSDVIAVVAAAVGQSSAARMLWDISDASVDEWTEARVQALIEGLTAVVGEAPGLNVALVAEGSRGAVVRRTVEGRFPLRRLTSSVETFSNRAAALDWLGVMHLPIGSADPIRQPA